MHSDKLFWPLHPVTCFLGSSASSSLIPHYAHTCVPEAPLAWGSVEQPIWTGIYIAGCCMRRVLTQLRLAWKSWSSCLNLRFGSPHQAIFSYTCTQQTELGNLYVFLRRWLSIQRHLYQSRALCKAVITNLSGLCHFRGKKNNEVKRRLSPSVSLAPDTYIHLMWFENPLETFCFHIFIKILEKIPFQLGIQLHLIIKNLKLLTMNYYAAGQRRSNFLLGTTNSCSPSLALD